MKVIEMAGIGPGPMAAMLLSDLGADVIRVDRIGAMGFADVLNRGRPSIGVNVKSPDGVETVLRLVEQADVLIEGFRPGVMERNGLGPDDCLARNPKLVYGRMTGWGQEGPLAHAAGHDINYISIAGVLANFAREGEKPVPPVNLVGDFGGGALYLVVGVLAALVEARTSGQGQVVDTAMVDGAASLMTMIYSFRNAGMWSETPGTNMLDTGAPYYDVYETADGRYVSVGAIERQFYAELLKGLELDPATLPDQNDRSQWPAMKQRFTDLFKSKTRDEWQAIFEGTDACVAPVLHMDEARDHPHMKARATVVQHDGAWQPAPAPRFSRTTAEIQRGPSLPCADTDAALQAWGFDAAEVTKLREAGAVG